MPKEHKAGVGDIRESPTLKILNRLRAKGAVVAVHDRYVPSIPAVGPPSVPPDEALTLSDVAVVVTASGA